MNYAVVQDMIDRFGEGEVLDVADDGTGAIDTAKVETAINSASRLIDTYLRQRGMTVPLDPAPDVVLDAAADIARFKLHDDEPSDSIKERYKSTIAWLKDVAAGRASLGAEDTTTAPAGRVVRREGKSGFDWGTHVA